MSDRICIPWSLCCLSSIWNIYLLMSFSISIFIYFVHCFNEILNFKDFLLQSHLIFYREFDKLEQRCTVRWLFIMVKSIPSTSYSSSVKVIYLLKCVNCQNLIFLTSLRGVFFFILSTAHYSSVTMWQFINLKMIGCNFRHSHRKLQ